MGFDNFLRISGQIDYFGLDEYPSTESDFDGNWGIWDQAYLQYFNSELSKKTEPFFSSVFTLTSHDPYQIPDQYKGHHKEESGGQPRSSHINQNTGDLQGIYPPSRPHRRQ